MTDSSQHTVTQLLTKLQEGNETAVGELFELVYEELRTLAHRRRRTWPNDQTLNTTALVHEAYLKLVDPGQANWTTRAHFFATAARAMRHILINHAKGRRRQKRGGGQPKLSFEELNLSSHDNMMSTEDRTDALAALDEALTRLEMTNPRQSRIVECRFFAGMTIKETAAALEMSPMTVKRAWNTAQL